MIGMSKFTDEELEVAKSYVKGYEQHCVDYRNDMIWEMEMSLGLEREEAEELWDEVV